MIRILCVVALVALAACGGATRPEDGARAAEGPTISIGGSMRAYYGHATP